MGIIGSNWKEEETSEEKYNNITGDEYSGRDESELRKDIEKTLDDPYTSKSERKALLNLLQEINNKNE